MKRLLMVVSVVFVGMLAWGFGRGVDEPSAVVVGRLTDESWDELVPGGKEVDAILGDFVLRNRFVTAVIAQTLATRHANMTVRDVGGCLIDLTARPDESDQLSAFYPGAKRYPFQSVSARGGDGAVVDWKQHSIVKSATGELISKGTGNEGRLAVEVTYRLTAESAYLTVISKFTNTSDKPIQVPLTDELRLDHGKEDVVKSPDGETDLFWIHDVHWGQAYGLISEQSKIVANSNTKTTSFQYALSNDKPSTMIEPGQSFELVRHIVPGAHLPAVRAVVGVSRHNAATVPVELSVLDGANRPVPNARIELFRNGHSWGIVPSDRSGRAISRLPHGQYEIEVSAFGVKVLGADQRAKFSLTEGDSKIQQTVLLSRFLTGVLDARLTDTDGQPLPVKIELNGQGDTASPNFAPETADLVVKNLIYCPLGTAQQELQAGTYRAIVSHGPEFDALFTEVAIKPGQKTLLSGTLPRSVQTPGWVSGDFHSHSSPSGDNTGSQLGRVANLVCEHIEFAPCTEHNRIDTYQPHIERLGISKFISSCTGIELTGSPLPLNHQNAFPLVHKPRTQDGGGPVTDTDPVAQIERLATWDNRSEKLVQINHPDFGWMSFDRNGDGKPDDGFQRMFTQMDVVEVHPIDRILAFEPSYELSGRKLDNRVFSWLQLLNQGFHLPGVVNTDAHYNFHGSGWLRNWIQSPTDDPSAIKPLDIVHATEQGRVILSNGPYLEVQVSEAGNPKSVTSGASLEAKSGRVTVAVRVQCPNWFDIDRVFLLANGRIAQDHDYRKAKHPDRFRSGAVKFDDKLELSLKEDSHLIVVAAGENSTLGQVAGPEGGRQHPTALCNPIYVDVDGSGFRPNKDTLGHPLPTKFVTK